MADYFVDHGAYAAQGVIGAANPTTWAVPQEGDGSATTAAAASAVAFVTFSAVPTTGTISVCGISISTTGVIGAASADAAANTLATNINAVTTTVAAGVAGGVPALKNLVFARGPAGGAPAGTCQVMMRVGSAALNYANNTNCLIATTLDNRTESAANKQFSGGSGGCWGWFISDVTVGGSSATYGAGGYGLLTAVKPFVSVASGTSVLGEPAAGDVTWGRSGAGQTITLPTNVAPNMGSAFNLTFVLDSNTKWTGDSGTGQVTVSMAISNLQLTMGLGSLTNQRNVMALKKDKLRFFVRSAVSGGHLNISCQNASNYPRAFFRNLLWEEAATLPTTQSIILAPGNYSNFVFDQCTFDIRVARTNWSAGVFCGINNLAGRIDLRGCTFKTNFTGVSDPTPMFNGVVSGTNVTQMVRLSGCVFDDINGKKVTPFGSITTPLNATFVVEDCYGFKIDSGTYVGNPQFSIGRDDYSGHAVFKSAEVGGTFRDEFRQGVCDWIYGANYPTLTATQPDGTPWSIKMDWLVTADIVTMGTPFRSCPLNVIYREAAATKTVTLQCLVPDAETLDVVRASIRVVYVSNTTGKVVTETTLFDPAAYLASDASWTLNGLTNYSAKKFVLTTTEPIKQNTKITVFMEFSGAPTGANRQIYIDPEFTLT